MSSGVASHEQQIEAILRHHPVPEHFSGTTIPAWWRDSITGSSFEKRPGLMGFLTEVAEKYPQPEQAPGRLFIYDESRFSRALVDAGAPALHLYSFNRADAVLDVLARLDLAPATKETT